MHEANLAVVKNAHTMAMENTGDWQTLINHDTTSCNNTNCGGRDAVCRHDDA